MVTQTRDKRKEQVGGRALERSAMYQLLSQATAYPSLDTVETLKTVDLPQAAQAAAGLPSELQAMIADLSACLEATDAAALQAEHRRGFSHVLSPDCPPCETPYTTRDVYQETQELSDIRGFFRAFGLDLADKERPDHISVELEFMQFLTYKEAYALRNHGPAKARLCRDVQRKFMKDHLGRWAHRFAGRLAGKAGGGYFARVASLTAAFVAADLAFLRTQPEDALVNPEARMTDQQDNTCPAAEACSLEELGGRDAREN